MWGFVYINYYLYLCIVSVNNEDGFGSQVGGRRGYTPSYFFKIKKLPAVNWEIRKVMLLNSS